MFQSWNLQRALINASKPKRAQHTKRGKVLQLERFMLNEHFILVAIWLFPGFRLGLPA